MGQLKAWMLRMLDSDDRIFGTVVAMEPWQFDGRRKDFALYAYRSEDGLQTKMLPPKYKYREHRWYSDPKHQQKALWSEPFFDEGGGDIHMITYSAPIMRDGKFAGVVTADLKVAYFADMRRRLDEVKLGRNGYGFVISPSGMFISHPDPDFQMPKNITEMPSFQEQEALRTLTKRLLNREKGSVNADDPSTGKKSVFYFAPIVSAHWSFVAVFEE